MTDLPSLYEISKELSELLESDDYVSDRLDVLLPTLEHKAAAVAHFVSMQEDLAETLKRREEAIKEQRKILEARAARSKAYLLECMTLAEILKVSDSRTGTEIALKKNPPKVVVDDSGEIPNEFWRVPDPPPPSPDLKALAVALKVGDVPGCHLESAWRVEIRG